MLCTIHYYWQADKTREIRHQSIDTVEELMEWKESWIHLVHISKIVH